MHATLKSVTEAIVERSKPSREMYEARMQAQMVRGPRRTRLSCGNLAHASAACGHEDKSTLAVDAQPNLAIVSAYNDMLSAHQPFERYPELIRAAARDAKAVAQFAGGVPAMCDGVTQGRPGMELSLFSRDVIAMSTAVALSHDMFDGVLCLGVCDKIVPGLMIGALSFGHLPVVFVPAGPMPSGLSNSDKAKVRKQYARGEIGRPELLASESAAYHSPGTCTFYGTANSNQMLMEFMGLHLPGASFVAPNTDLRDALTRAATARAAASTALHDDFLPMYRVIDAKAVINGIVGLLATGGSTNHTLHLVAMARAAGVVLNWSDFARLSEVVPLLARVYPNGSADVNHMHSAGGLGFLIGQLLDAGLLHADVQTVVGEGLKHYRTAPALEDGRLAWTRVSDESGDEDVLRPVGRPFATTGGLRVVDGSLGRGVVKVSAVDEDRRTVVAPARVFDDQDDFLAAFKAGTLDIDHV
ncbi:MAG: phosphogluconate dehydratase, partial [Myxococcota bacterium]